MDQTSLVKENEQINVQWEIKTVASDILISNSTQGGIQDLHFAPNTETEVACQISIQKLLFIRLIDVGMEVLMVSNIINANSKILIHTYYP